LQAVLVLEQVQVAPVWLVLAAELGLGPPKAELPLLQAVSELVRGQVARLAGHH
jgi:hypothetical protein